MISIAIFNNKGGVGKTTLLSNLAAFFKLKGKRVLVVDADPQCNATTYLLDEELIEKYYSEDTNTTYNLIDPYEKGEYEVIPKPVHSKGFDVDLLLGDTRVARIEDFLSKEWTESQNGTGRSIKTLCFIKSYLKEINDKYDYVFFDVGPSLGALNRIILLSVSCFIIPMSSDIFSLRALENISEGIVKWRDDINSSLSRYKELQKQPYKIKGEDVVIMPNFLGYVTQQYKAKSKDGIKVPVKAYEIITSQIPDKIQSTLADFYPEDLTYKELKLGDIPNFNSLIPLSQACHKAIFLMDSQDGVFGAHFSKVEEYRGIMQHVIDNVESNLKRYGLA